MCAEDGNSRQLGFDTLVNGEYIPTNGDEITLQYSDVTVQVTVTKAKSRIVTGTLMVTREDAPCFGGHFRWLTKRTRDAAPPEAPRLLLFATGSGPDEAAFLDRVARQMHTEDENPGAEVPYYTLLVDQRIFPPRPLTLDARCELLDPQGALVEDGDIMLADLMQHMADVASTPQTEKIEI